jgi:transposase-like protein
MTKTNKFSPEMRERAVRMVQEHRGEYPSLWAAVESIAPKIGCVAQTLLDWVKRDEVDKGQREGVDHDDTSRGGSDRFALDAGNPYDGHTLAEALE